VRHSDLVIGPRVVTLFAGGRYGNRYDAAALFMVGSSIGYAARIGKTTRILPELSVVGPLGGVASAGWGEGGGSFLTESVVVTFNVGLLLGGRPAPGPTP
jgi:hypothetical protein